MGVCSLNHDTTTSYMLSHTPFSLKFTPTCTCNMAIRMHPYAHTQHLKVQKHFAYIFYGCGVQSMGAFSLNHDTTTSYRLSHTPFSLKFIPTCTRLTAIRMYPYAHPQHLKMLKHFVYILYGCGMQSMGFFSFNHDTTTSYRLGHTPVFLKFIPTCHNVLQIRMHPYAHPQHLKLSLKVLKHFVYIQYGCGVQSMGVCSLNHDTTSSYRLRHTPVFLKCTPTCTHITA